MSDRKAIRYISLAAKAGRLIIGFNDCEKAVRKQRKIGMMILAADAGGNTIHRAERLAEAPGVKLMVTEYSKSELAAAVGRGGSVALALVADEGLAAAFAAASANGMEQEERK